MLAPTAATEALNSSRLLFLSLSRKNVAESDVRHPSPSLERGTTTTTRLGDALCGSQLKHAPNSHCIESEKRRRRNNGEFKKEEGETPAGQQMFDSAREHMGGPLWNLRIKKQNQPRKKSCRNDGSTSDYLPLMQDNASQFVASAGHLLSLCFPTCICT